MGLFNSISNKIANAIGKKNSVKLTNYGQQRVKEYKAAGIDTSKKISSPLPQTTKSIAAEKKDQKKSSSSKSSSSKSSSSKSSSNKSSNKSSNTLYTLTNPFATQKAYASTGSLASSNAPSMGINSLPNGAITTPMTSSIATSSLPQQSKATPSYGDVLLHGYGKGAWADTVIGKILKAAGYINPVAFIASNIIGKERGITENYGGEMNSVQEALNIQPTTLTQEGQDAYKEATEKATELGYVKDDGTPDTTAYLEDVYRTMLKDLPTDDGTPAPAGALAGTVTPVGSAWDPNNMPPGDEVFASLKEGATAEQAAAIDAAIAEYDRQRASTNNSR